MVYTVYIDEVFAVNMAMDLMVLMAVNQVLCYRAGAAQIVRGAALGGGLGLCNSYISADAADV